MNREIFFIEKGDDHVEKKLVDPLHLHSNLVLHRHGPRGTEGNLEIGRGSRGNNSGNKGPKLLRRPR